METWKDILGFEGMYQVSDAGRVRSLDRINSKGKRCRGSIRKLCCNRNGYKYVNLCKDGKSHNFLVHRLVASAFVVNPEEKPTVNHINENKHDNRASNLEWMTLAENLRYGAHNARAIANKPDMSGVRHFNYGKRGAESHTHKGKVFGISIEDPTKIIEFDTAATASRVLGVNSGRLCEAIKGKRKSYGGYYWRRADG